MLRRIKYLFNDECGEVAYGPMVLAFVLTTLSLVLIRKVIFDIRVMDSLKDIAIGFGVLLVIAAALMFVLDRKNNSEDEKQNYKKNRYELIEYANATEYKIIKKITKEEVGKSEIEELLKQTIFVETSKFLYSNIDYPFVSGYRLFLKDKEYPFNVVVLKR